MKPKKKKPTPLVILDSFIFWLPNDSYALPALLIQRTYLDISKN